MFKPVIVGFILASLFGGCSGNAGTRDMTTDCQYPQQTPPDAGNDPRCPSQYGGPLGSLCFLQACSPEGLNCKYYGAGDGPPGCQAIAVMVCRSMMARDGGTNGGAVWICAN